MTHILGAWTIATGEAEMIGGKSHGNQVQDVKVADNKLYSVAMDDTFMVSDAVTGQCG